jgi:hypothetical protein
MRLNGFSNAEQLRFFVLRDNVGQSPDLSLDDPHIHYGERVEGDILNTRSGTWYEQYFKVAYLCFPESLEHVIIRDKVKHQL